MDYEKKRYNLEKELENNNDNSLKTTIKNNDELINLLKQYKEELNDYGINYNKNAIKKELDNQQLFIDNLKGIQKVKK